MPSHSIPRKYAEAIFKLAEKTDGVEAIRNDLESLVRLVQQTPALLPFLESSDVAQQERLKFLERTLKGRVKQSTWFFLMLLLRRKRVALLAEILSEYVGMDEERKGIQRVRVVSAVSLEKGEREFLTSRLRDITGKDVVVETVVDPSTMGGVIVYLDGKVIDGSVRSHLENLKCQLLMTPVD